LSLIEEDVIFGLVAHKRAEIFANDAVPVGAVLLVELFLDVFGHQVLHLQVVDRVFCLRGGRNTYFSASAIMSELSGMSIMFYFFITSVICNLLLHQYIQIQLYHHSYKRNYSYLNRRMGFILKWFHYGVIDLTLNHFVSA
jgi:hypothetical protein